ncbi:hypothetical protein NECAME_00690 [Necator americanus]|uniref:Ribosomal protein S28 n=1 Tax=Necator americanus TaxID=51031 RepID=W2T163_NECAM|nr:hypothetical protein NECAME_00690 [Necator americanus]ETN75279.1 hypothetical protein NECAME_00690 [Necator americanus]
MREVARLLKHTTSIVRSATFRYCSVTKPVESETAASGSTDDLNEFVSSLGRDVTDANKLGDFNGRLVTGRIVHRVQDDLYIDFGLKFNAVCKAPAVNSETYREGATVLLRLHDPELSERFLGSEHDMTLLEADATLIRLLHSPSGKGGMKARKSSPADAPAANAVPSTT